MTVKIEWIDSGLEPRSAPNPAYPNGVDIDLAKGKWGCKVPLPYPAKRIGNYVLECDICGLRVTVTTAGRPDDPRSVTMPCNGKGATLQ